ncbi:hypothetical protein TNIN_409351 [Trichonephila inaurata madagascariensis]|uniref:Uncharacterized protein n=1 Tax=Trichonephila inaurata madagascariensis TaxID=2747483 RepID=A0A8X7CNJ1_9ARAC|nr:hypothetical protein TNIN_409351 [Trichonephila inaurata madagascariensis]
MDQQDYETSDMDLVNSPRRTPTPPLLSACEQILQNKAQLQKMETFKKYKTACISELKAMPDHHPDVPPWSSRRLKNPSTWRIVRPNVSYAQAANPINQNVVTSNSQNRQQMAPKEPVNSAQTEAKKNSPPKNRFIPNFNNKFNGNFNGNIFNSNNFNLQATLQMTMQCLCQLSQFTQAIASSNPNFMNNFNQVQNANNSPNQMYALLEASCNNNNG